MPAPLMAFSSLIPRIEHRIRLRGAKATALEAAHSIRNKLYLEETHVWYELPLKYPMNADRPKLDLKPGMELVRGGEEDLPLLDDFPSISGPDAKIWLESGSSLWILFDGWEPVFVCWTFRGPARFKAAQGWISLPPEVVLMEESAASPLYRGRGLLAPVVWSQIADRLQDTGAASLITKVEEQNKVMRWSLSRAGFREIFTASFRRTGPLSHTAIRAQDVSSADWLAKQTNATVLTVAE